MTQCEVCEWEATLQVFVRPRTGGRRTPRHFCCVECKESGLRVLEQQGLIETQGVRGWDVFRLMWD